MRLDARLIALLFDYLHVTEMVPEKVWASG
jgi:hypothetical protein